MARRAAPRRRRLPWTRLRSTPMREPTSTSWSCTTTRLATLIRTTPRERSIARCFVAGSRVRAASAVPTSARTSRLRPSRPTVIACSRSAIPTAGRRICRSTSWSPVRTTWASSSRSRSSVSSDGLASERSSRSRRPPWPVWMPSQSTRLPTQTQPRSSEPWPARRSKPTWRTRSSMRTRRGSTAHRWRTCRAWDWEPSEWPPQCSPLRSPFAPLSMVGAYHRRSPTCHGCSCSVRSVRSSASCSA